jgi:hypothetical protein
LKYSSAWQAGRVFRRFEKKPRQFPSAFLFYFSDKFSAKNADACIDYPKRKKLLSLCQVLAGRHAHENFFLLKAIVLVIIISEEILGYPCIKFSRRRQLAES